MSKYNKGIVYVVKCGDFFKIGITKDLDKRIMSLQVGNPVKIEPFLRILPIGSARKLEKELHEKFTEKSISGEWFSLSIADLRFVFEEYAPNLFFDCGFENFIAYIGEDSVIETSDMPKLHKEALRKIEESQQESKTAIDLIELRMPMFTLSNHGKKKLTGYVHNYGIETTIKAIEYTTKTFYDGKESEESWNRAFNAIPSVARDMKKGTFAPKVYYYIYGILKNRFSRSIQKNFFKNTNDYKDSFDWGQLVEFAKQCESYWEFMDEFYLLTSQESKTIEV